MGAILLRVVVPGGGFFKILGPRARGGLQLEGKDYWETQSLKLCYQAYFAVSFRYF